MRSRPSRLASGSQASSSSTASTTRPSSSNASANRPATRGRPAHAIHTPGRRLPRQRSVLSLHGVTARTVDETEVASTSAMKPACTRRARDRDGQLASRVELAPMQRELGADDNGPGQVRSRRARRCRVPGREILCEPQRPASSSIRLRVQRDFDSRSSSRRRSLEAVEQRARRVEAADGVRMPTSTKLARGRAGRTSMPAGARARCSAARLEWPASVAKACACSASSTASGSPA